ncbi:MAG: hypothetical protein PHW59_09580 [Desulfobacterales bacterium]|nr:hypothetical protein [Desulfobacterales bacterium]
MAFNALSQLGNAGEASVFAEEMATFTSLSNGFNMQSMIEIDRLFLLGVEKLRKDNPSYNDTDGKPDKKIQDQNSTGSAFLPFPIHTFYPPNLLLQTAWVDPLKNGQYSNGFPEYE